MSATRRGFLAFLGLGAGAAAAVKVSDLLPAPARAAPTLASPPIPIFQEGDLVYNGIIIRECDDTIYNQPLMASLKTAQREINERRSRALNINWHSAPKQIVDLRACDPFSDIEGDDDYDD